MNEILEKLTRLLDEEELEEELFKEEFKEVSINTYSHETLIYEKRYYDLKPIKI